MPRYFLIAGSLSAFIAVGLGAFAAHTLKDKLPPELMNIMEVGVRYQMYHAFALIAVAWAITQWPAANVAPAGWLFIVGTIVFSGSLYLLALTSVMWFGAITPLGGVCFLAGWGWMAWCAWRSL